MRSAFLTLSRFAVSAWVGAACLFVVTSVQEQISPRIDSATRGYLALLRFPTYYQFGFALVAAAGLFGVAAWGHAAVRGWRMKLSLGLLVLALAGMTVDYVLIYRPLAEMTRNEVEARPAAFHSYHRASMWANTTTVSLCLLAALLINWPDQTSGKS